MTGQLFASPVPRISSYVSTVVADTGASLQAVNKPKQMASRAATNPRNFMMNLNFRYILCYYSLCRYVSLGSN